MTEIEKAYGHGMILSTYFVTMLTHVHFKARSAFSTKLFLHPIPDVAIKSCLVDRYLRRPRGRGPVGGAETD